MAGNTSVRHSAPRGCGDLVWSWNGRRESRDPDSIGGASAAIGHTEASHERIGTYGADVEG